MARGNDRQQNSTDEMALIVIPIFIIFILIVGWMTWRHGLYFYSGKMAYWMLWPLDWIQGVHDYRRGIVTHMADLPDPGLVVEWVGNAWRLPSALVGAIAIVCGVKAFKHPILSLKGPLSVDALMRYQAQVHSPIAPIVPIAKSIHKNEDERFHESYHPHEVVERFNLVNKDRSLNKDAAEKYFLAQLGKRVYRPGLDDPNTIFADRLSNYEKTMFALLAPLAIHMKDGLDEYNALNDALNYSAVNSTQTPNLTLANEIYAKYRSHPQLNALFRRHHFSTTYLMQLYILAKRAGKVTTSHWVGWLRPNVSTLYVALNTAGRETPFTESAGAFAHWKFELECVKKNMMPILPCVVGAIVGLEEEWEFWKEADPRETPETLWGRMTTEQSARDLDLFRKFVTEKLIPQHAVPAGANSLFDQEESASRKKFEDDQLTKIMSGVKDSLGPNETGNEPGAAAASAGSAGTTQS
jgi:hypothetical protein